MSQTSEVSEWIATLKWEAIPKDVIQIAKACLRDYIGCTAGGARSTPGRICRQAAIKWGGPPEATIIGTYPKVSARNAAFANGMMANALDYDDTLFGHPGSTTFSTALAAAEKWRANGKEFLLSAIIGYEISARAASLLNPIIPRYVAVWDAGAVQAYGSTACAARLAGFDAGQISNALGIISATSPVPLPRKARYPGEGRSMIKSCHGWVADSSVAAVELTQAGLTGPGHVFDGNLGFWKMKPSKILGINNFAEKLGDQWAIRQISFKPYMSCRFIHPILQGIEEIMHQIEFFPEQIKNVEISSFSLLKDEHHNILRPVSITDAQFSVPYTTVAMLCEGEVTPDSYMDEKLTDPNIHNLMDKVIINDDPEHDKAFPDKLEDKVKIVLNNGITKTVQIDNPKGSPERPMTESELQRKYEILTIPLLGAQKTNEIGNQITIIDNLPDLDTLSDLLMLET